MFFFITLRVRNGNKKCILFNWFSNLIRNKIHFLFHSFEF